MSSSKSSQRQLAWQWLKSQETFTKKQLTDAVEITASAANGLITFLREQKRIKQITARKGCIGAKYKVVNTDYLQFGSGSRKGCRNTKGKKGSAKQRCWSTMRVLRAFTIGDVRISALLVIKTVGLLLALVWLA